MNRNTQVGQKICKTNVYYDTILVNCSKLFPIRLQSVTCNEHVVFFFIFMIFFNSNIDRSDEV